MAKRARQVWEQVQGTRIEGVTLNGRPVTTDYGVSPHEKEERPRAFALVNLGKAERLPPNAWVLGR